MIEGRTYMDGDDILVRSAAALRRIHSYEGAQLQETLVSMHLLCPSRSGNAYASVSVPICIVS